MRSLTRILLVSAGPLLLGGCGLNALRVQSAQQTASLADAVSSSAHLILSDAQARRNRALLTLVASDDSCSARFPLWIYVPEDAAAAAQPGIELCADGSVGKDPDGYKREKLDLSPLASDALRPTIDLLAALGAYEEALNKIVNAPKTDVAKELDQALALAQKAHAQASALGISGVPELPKLSDDQKKVAVALIQMIVDLAHEKKQVDYLRKVYPQYAAKLGHFCAPSEVAQCSDKQNKGLFKDLALQIDDWAKIVGQGASQITVNNLHRAYRKERKDLSFEGRIAFVTLIQEASKEVDRAKEAGDLFKQAVSGLSDEHENLGRRLYNPSADDKKQADAITRERIATALSLILKALSAWKVI